MHKKYLFCCAIAMSFIISTSAMADFGCAQKIIVHQENYSAMVEVPKNEACSDGTYKLTVNVPEQPQQTIPMVRDGTIAQVWMEKLNQEQTPSIIVWSQSAGSGGIGKLDVFKLDKNNQYVQQEITVPENLKEGHNGHETFSVKDGEIYVAFPLYKKNDPNCCPTGGTAKFKYDFTQQKWLPTK